MNQSLRAAASAALIIAAAACSSTGGFGAPGPYPNPPAPGQAVPQASGTPAASASPGSISPPEISSPAPQASGSPPPPSISVENAAARLAYDGSATDPGKAPRLLVLSFVLKNTTDKAANVRKATLAIQDTQVASTAIAVAAPAGQNSPVTTLALKVDENMLKSTTLKLALLDNKGKMVTSGDVDVGSGEISFTALDKKQTAPPGLAVEGIDISQVSFAENPVRYVCTFALTNGNKAKVSIDHFTLTPPKGAAADVNLPLTVPPRTTTGFVSFVLRLDGKSLPKGTYKVGAVGTGSDGKAGTLATGASPLL